MTDIHFIPRFVTITVDTLKMLSTPQTINSKNGGTAECHCEFISDDFSMFENPILWKKQQSLEVTSINIMGNILEPFLSTNRFQVTFHSSEDHRYQLTLKIIGRLLADVVSIRFFKNNMKV